jgi:long-chain acyl-CoA synthetase
MQQQTFLFGERHIDASLIREDAARAASGFASMGIGAGDTVAVLMRNEPAYLSVMLAVQKLGAYYVAINWHFKQDEAGFVVTDSNAKVLVVHADLWPGVAQAVPPQVQVILVPTPPEVIEAYRLSAPGSAPERRVLDWTSWLQGFNLWAQPDLPPLGSIYYTSGTTGRPKGVRRLPGTPEQAAAWHRTRAVATKAWQGFRTAIVGPLYHGGPNTAAVVALNMASLVVMFPRFDAEALLKAVHEHKLTHLPLVPIMLIRLLGLPEDVRSRYDVSSLEIVTHGGSACPPEIKRRAIAWLGPKLVETYGASEVGLVTMITTEEWLRHPGSVGRPFDGTTIRILDEDGGVLGPHQSGEIWVNPGANSLPFTYQNNEQARREVERDGFIANGDIGYLNEEGYLFITDRKRDMIVSGGVNIYPAEIEKELILCPGVRDCAVFGGPDPEYGERVLAAVQLEPGCTTDRDEILTFLRPRIASYKIPRLIEFHDELPRDSMGKVFKYKLREPHWRNEGRRI